MKKILIIILFVAYYVLRFTYYVLPAHAADVTITCSSAGCSSSSSPFFNETNIYPGFSSTHTMEVVNNRQTPCNLHQSAVNTTPESILPPELIFDISRDSSVYFNGTLKQLFDADYIDLETIGVGQSQEYIWGSTFNQTAGNSYQNTNVVFDLNSNFTCDDLPAPTDTPTPTPPPTNTSNNPPTCNDPAPLAPTNLRTRRLADGRVTLMWTETTSSHTGYLVAYGNTPGSYQYGVPDIGNDDHFTVGGLTYGAQYCFYVRSLNGCMPGENTPEVCVNRGATPGTIVPIPQASPGVLGTSTTETPIGSGQTQGTNTSNCAQFWIPLLFLIALVLNSLILILMQGSILIPSIISIITYLIDRYMLQTHCCQPGYELFCRYYYLGNIGSVVLPWLISRLASRRR